MSDYVLIRHKSAIFGKLNTKVMEKNTQMANVGDTFTPKEEKFCYEYCIDLNATKAAIRAGYSGKTARSIGYQNLLKLHIQKRIKETQSDLAKAAGISALKVIMEHSKIAFASVSDLYKNWSTLNDFNTLSEDQKACIQEIRIKDTKEGQDISVKMFSKSDSLEAICKLLGFYAPVKSEVKLDYDGMSDEQLDSLINNLLNKSK